LPAAAGKADFVGDAYPSTYRPIASLDAVVAQPASSTAASAAVNGFSMVVSPDG
jgi:hypothetical protein